MNNFLYNLVKYFNTAIGFGLLVLLCLHISAPYAALFCGVLAITMFIYGCYSMIKDRKQNNKFKKWLKNKRR